jgi:hypothetical protein
MREDELDLHDQGVELTLRLVTTADRLQQIAEELQTLADTLRRQRAQDTAARNTEMENNA